MQSEKTGVDANVISLPKGGGAMQGMGETFSADLFSGAGNYSIPITVPKGRMGMQPQLSLGYSTGNGNGPIGLGWSMALPGIMRKTSLGIPQYRDEDDIFVLSGAEDLIPVNKEVKEESGVSFQVTGYKPRTEGLFARINHFKGDDGSDYWKVQTKDGKASYYGNPSVGDGNPCTLTDPDNDQKIYQWKIYKTVDLLGNEVVYEYEYAVESNGSTSHTQIYLNKIKYANYLEGSELKHLCSVAVNYDDRPDHFSMFNSGFEIRTKKRISNIETFTHPNDGDLPVGYTAPDRDWISEAAPANNQWRSIAYGNGIFVAVAGGTSQVMRSTDGGANWTLVSGTEANNWRSVAFGNGVFVAVATNGSNQVMRSTDGGENWTTASASEANGWSSVTYGNGVFVAVAGSGNGSNWVMRSTDDGITWTSEDAAEDNNWMSITFGNGVFVAVSQNGTNRVMRSDDAGLTWSSIPAAEDHTWFSVTYGNGVFVAVTQAVLGVGNQVMRSTDGGLNWTSAEAAATDGWDAVTFGNGMFMAVALGSSQVMRSIDGGETWSLGVAAATEGWFSIAYGDGVFVAVAMGGTNPIMRLPMSQNDILVKRTVLTYQDETPAGAPENGVSLLVNVQVEGHGPDKVESMPPVEFKYSEFDGDSRDLIAINGAHLPPTSLANPNMSLVDLDGNGLPDMVEMIPGLPIRFWKNKGNGEFDLPRTMKDAPLSLSVEAGQAQLMDANGDGRADLVINTANIQGYYSLRLDGQWDAKSYTAYETVPTVNFASADVKFMDLTGDGRTDVIINDDRSLVCYFQNSPLLSEVGEHSEYPEKPGWSEVKRVRKQDSDHFPNVNFGDPRIRTADLSGDGLQDIVMVTNGGVFYWPNLGYGRFGAKRQMRNAPRPGFNFDPNRVILADINGDGLTDYIYINTNSVDYWINQSGNAWGEMKTVKGTPRFTSRDSIQVVDLMGTGTPGLLWSYDLGANRDRFYFVDLTRGVKPYLLNEVNNNLGAVTKVEYTPSTFFYLRDKNGTEGNEFNFIDPVGEWKTRLPFPVLTVSKVESIDRISKTKLTSRYFYHHGYWDGVEREFRGFGRVDQFDTETFDAYNANGLLLDENFDGVAEADYSPPIYTKNWFHLGPVEDDSITGYRRGETDWTEVNYLDEYWEGDAPMLERPAEFYSLISGLSRRARRDAYRTLRGTALRSELFAKDGSTNRKKPYSVKETQNSIQLIDSPATNEVIDAYRTLRHSNHIYFPYQYSARESMWERGLEPKTSFSFTGELDQYGQVLSSLSIAVPRGKDPLTGGELDDAPHYDSNHSYAAVLSTSEYFDPDSSDPYFVDRMIQSKAEELTGIDAMSVFAIRDAALADSLTKNLLGHQLNYYDGAQYVGEPYGTMGDYGLLVRSEILAVTPAELTAAYGGAIPPAFAGVGTPDWSAYPAGFVSELSDTRLGFTYYPGGESTPHVEGYYATGEKLKYDLQDSQSTHSHGLVVAMRDVYDHETTIEYDGYALLPRRVVDPVGMEVSSSNDYRLLVPNEMTDPNQNVTKVGFNALGLVEKTLLCGKDDGTEGDTFVVPGALFEYDFFAFMNDGDPISVKKTVREHHVNADYISSLPIDEQKATIESAEYSDGYGRIIQSRTQAEDLIYGDQKFGDSGLSADMSQLGDMVGVERDELDPLNVVVSGHKRYNNKGEVVEQYEPYYDAGFDYAEDDTPTGATIKMYYDALGRMVKTKNPDDSEQRVIFGIPNALNTPDDCLPTPWERYTYDANDLAPITHPGGDNGGVLASHHFTPKSELIDVLGRVVETTEHEVYDDSGLYDGSITYDDVVMKYEYDIKGQLTKSIDPYLRTISENIYDTAGNMLSSTHIDRGTQTLCVDAMGLPVQTTDSKGAETLTTYDTINRPLKMRAKDQTGEAFTLRIQNTYGDSAGLTDSAEKNLNGALYVQYDGAGKLQFTKYDFKGNLKEKFRNVIKDDLLLVKLKFTADWDTLDDTDLDSQKYQTNMEYDGLNRPRKIISPEDQDAERKETIPTYNRAGALQKLNFDGEDYVNEVAYNARGQKIMTASASVFTRYTYDTETFRVVRIRTSKYNKTGNTWTPISGIRLNRGYAYDLMGSVVKEYNYTPRNVWAEGAGNLIRYFTHDPMRRLLSATGRENRTPLVQPTWNLNYSPDDHTQTKFYTRDYLYDKIGNIRSLKHDSQNNGQANFTRKYKYDTQFVHNQMEVMTIGSTDYSYSYDANGNQVLENSERHYEWNYADKLAFFKNQVGTSDPTKWSHYMYDNAGNRIKKVVNTGTGKQVVTVYIDGIFEHSYTKNSGTIDTTRHYNTHRIMEGSSLVATLQVGNDADDTINIAKKFYTADHLGNIAATYEESSTLINFEEYYPFGETSYGGYAKKRYRYNGKEKDNDTGLYEYGHRYYAPWLCRFVSVDPIAEDFPQLSSYNYASNRPETARDLEGLQAEGETKFKTNETQNLNEVEVKPKSFWQKAGNFLYENVAKNIPVVGGIINSIESFSEGDVLGGFLGIGEALLDGVLLVTTGGLGNLAKAGLKTTGKIIAKETAENMTASAVGGALGDDIPLGLQITAGLMGVRPKKWKNAKNSNFVEPSSVGAAAKKNAKIPKAETGNKAIHNVGVAKKVKPEGGYLKGKKHGIDWEEGPARANKEQKPQGQWGSKADLDFASEKASTITKSDNFQEFELPENHTSIVHMPDGTNVPATHIRIKNNGTGTFHGFPIVK